MQHTKIVVALLCIAIPMQASQVSVQEQGEKTFCCQTANFAWRNLDMFNRMGCNFEKKLLDVGAAFYGLRKARACIAAFEQLIPADILLKHQFIGALQKNDAEAIKEAIKDGWKDLSIEINQEPVFFSLNLDHTVCLQVLIDAGLDINAKSSKGISIFYYKVLNAPLSVYSWGDTLKRLGADIDATDDNGNTLLMRFVVEEKNLYNMEDLIKLGASLDKQDKDGNTALLLAVKHEEKTALITLLTCGANIHIKNNEGVSFVDFLNPVQLDDSEELWKKKDLCQSIYFEVLSRKRAKIQADEHKE